MRKPRVIRLWQGAVVAAAIPVIVQAFSSGAPPGLTGAPGEGNCTVCHAGFAATQNAQEIQLVLASGATYTPGARQAVSLRVNVAGALVYGFSLSVRNAANQQAGTLEAVSPNTSVVTDSGIQYLGHTRPLTAGQFDFQWTAPAAGAGPVTFYAVVNAANGNGTSSGDRIFLRSFTVNPAAAAVTPRLNQVNPVVNGASFQPGIAAGSWVTLFGTDLAPTTRIWNPATEIINGQLPKQLDGVSVNINGKPAAVYFISPTQLNVQAPDDEAEGPVSVEVVREGVRSAPATAQLRKNAPGLFVFQQGGNRYAAAVFGVLEGGQVVYVGPSDLFGGALRARKAKAGDVVLLYGTGFGKTNPAVPAGVVVSGAAPLVDRVTVRLGNVEAPVAFAGLAGAGLYQFNVTVPPGLPEGDVKVVVEINGVPTQDNVFLAIDR